MKRTSILLAVAIGWIFIFEPRAHADFRRRGGCLIRQLRHNQGILSSMFNADNCDRIASIKNGYDYSKLAETYGSFPDRLASIFDLAEKVACGDDTECITSKMDGTLVITADGAPGVVTLVSPQRTEFVIVISSGMIDFVEHSAWAVVASLHGINSPARMLANIDSYADVPCKNMNIWLGIDMPQNADDAIVINGSVQYEFILGHELSHIQSGNGRCGSLSNKSVDIEKKCDELAFRRLFAANRLLPPAIFLSLTAIAHYLAVNNEAWAKMYWPTETNATLLQKLPAADFRPRIIALADVWKGLCTSAASAGNVGCTDGWEKYADVWGRKIPSVPLPNPCK